MIRTLDELFVTSGERYRERPAWKAPNGERTHDAVLENGRRLANVLVSAGLRPGDRVGMMLDDVAEALETFAGIVLAGLVVVPVNRDFKTDELGHILEDSGARALVYSSSADAAVARTPQCEDLAVVVHIGNVRAEAAQALPYVEALERAGAAPISLAVDPEAPALIAYTSGTTGFPKGAVVSHRAVVACLHNVHGTLQMGNGARLANPGSLQFSATWWALLLPHVYVGGFARMTGRVDVDGWFDIMEADRSTTTYVPSPLIPRFIEAARRRPRVLESLQTVMHGSSIAPHEQIAELIEVVGDRFIEVYGSTESVGPVLATTRDDLHGPSEARDLYASTGRPTPVAAARLENEVGDPIAPGSDEVGELVIEADSLFSGYWNRPDATAEAFEGSWFRTGDLARMDAAGFVYIVGRRTELIISGGANVYPAEVERVLASMDGVAECAVFGLPDERWGEAVTAAVVAEPGAELGAEAVTAYVAARLAAYKKPRTVLFLDELPRNASLKVQKDRLTEMAANAAADAPAPRA